MPCVSVFEGFPHFKLNLSWVKFTSEIVWWTSVVLVSLSPLSSLSIESFQPSYMSWFFPQQLKTSMGGCIIECNCYL